MICEICGRFFRGIGQSDKGTMRKRNRMRMRMSFEVFEKEKEFEFEFQFDFEGVEKFDFRN